MLRSIKPTRPRVVISFLVALAAVAASACADPPHAKMTPTKPDPDSVAANSAAEQKMAMEGKPRTSTPSPEDPSQPLTTPLNAEPASATPTPAATVGKNGKPTKPGAKDPKEPKGGAGAGGSGDVTKVECKQLFDKYIDLTIGSDSRFEGIPPEMIAQMKASALAQAQSEKGDPCSTQKVSRAQYTCAVAAPTTKAWERCMK